METLGVIAMHMHFAHKHHCTGNLVHKVEQHTYEGQSNENLKYFFTSDLLNKSGTQVYHFST
jgi:hypothetical protein